MCIVIVIFAVLALIVYPPLILLAVAALIGFGIGSAIGSASSPTSDNENAVVGGAIGATIVVGLAIIYIACKIFGAIGIVPGIILIALIVIIIYNM